MRKFTVSIDVTIDLPDTVQDRRLTELLVLDQIVDTFRGEIGEQITSQLVYEVASLTPELTELYEHEDDQFEVEYAKHTEYPFDIEITSIEEEDPTTYMGGIH